MKYWRTNMPQVPATERATLSARATPRSWRSFIRESPSGARRRGIVPPGRWCPAGRCNASSVEFPPRPAADHHPFACGCQSDRRASNTLSQNRNSAPYPMNHEALNPEYSRRRRSGRRGASAGCSVTRTSEGGGSSDEVNTFGSSTRLRKASHISFGNRARSRRAGAERAYSSSGGLDRVLPPGSRPRNRHATSRYQTRRRRYRPFLRRLRETDLALSSCALAHHSSHRE